MMLYIELQLLPPDAKHPTYRYTMLLSRGRDRWGPGPIDLETADESEARREVNRQMTSLIKSMGLLLEDRDVTWTTAR
jgi:hypothetical protein